MFTKMQRFKLCERLRVFIAEVVLAVVRNEVKLSEWRKEEHDAQRHNELLAAIANLEQRMDTLLERSITADEKNKTIFELRSQLDGLMHAVRKVV